MSDPVIHAFFLGRAIAQAINEQIENSLTNALSELGKFDAEQRERLRQFTEQVIARAEREVEMTTAEGSISNTGATVSKPADLQETIDELRSEIARLRNELKIYRNQSV